MEQNHPYNFEDPQIYNNLLEYCPICRKKDIKLKYIIRRYNPAFKIDICKDCGFIFMNPQFCDKIVKKLYNKEYYRNDAAYSYQDERDIEDYASYVWEKRIKVLRKYAANGNILDIGSAFGGLLKVASKYYTPYGIEFSEYSGSFAKEIFNENIHIGTLDDCNFEKDSFSVITMIETLEHLKEPVKTIKQCYKLLKDRGILVIQTANMQGLQAKILKDRYSYYMPGHFSYFTRDNLYSLLKKEGFRRVKIFHPVEFGLLPKLLKSRSDFKSLIDYRKWLRISIYHFISKIRYKGFSLTSSMVLYAFK